MALQDKRMAQWCSGYDIGLSDFPSQVHYPTMTLLCFFHRLVTVFGG